jgi:putative tricarboxylic transport membrane protein
LGLYGLAEILRGALRSGGRSSAALNSEDHPEPDGQLRLQPLTAVGWLPALTCGIPGNAAPAMVLAVISVKGAQPLVNCAPPQAALVGAILAALGVGCLLLLPLGWAAARLGSQLPRPPAQLYLPVLLVLCILGAYLCRGDLFDVCVMLGLGIAGVTLSGARVPLMPLVLGLFLGRELEHRLIAGLAETGHGWEFFKQPMPALLAAACVAVWVYPLALSQWKRLYSRPAPATAPREVVQPELAVARVSEHLASKIA